MYQVDLVPDEDESKRDKEAVVAAGGGHDPPCHIERSNGTAGGV